MASESGPEVVETKETNASSTDRRCVFCRISTKDEQAAIVYEDDEYVCFRDRSPAATHHYLLIPRLHIRNPGALNRDHIPMIERMEEIARQVLSDQGGNPEDASYGYHWPPFIRVQHLHLHILSPPSSMGWFSKYILFRENSFAFTTHANMLDRLRSML